MTLLKKQIEYLIKEILDVEFLRNQYFVLETSSVDQVTNIVAVIDSLISQNELVEDSKLHSYLKKLPKIKFNRNKLEGNYLDDSHGLVIFFDIIFRTRRMIHMRKVIKDLIESKVIFQTILTHIEDL